MSSNVALAEDRLEFLVTTKSDKIPKVMQFEVIAGYKPEIETMTLLWNANSYHVNLPQRLFIINGGRRIHIQGWEDVESVNILYYKRHNREVSVNGDNGSPREGPNVVSYLRGWEGGVAEDAKQIMLHIGPNGKEWYWRDHR